MKNKIPFYIVENRFYGIVLQMQQKKKIFIFLFKIKTTNTYFEFWKKKMFWRLWDNVYIASVFKTQTCFCVTHVHGYTKEGKQFFILYKRIRLISNMLRVLRKTFRQRKKLKTKIIWKYTVRLLELSRTDLKKK